MRLLNVAVLLAAMGFATVAYWHAYFHSATSVAAAASAEVAHQRAPESRAQGESDRYERQILDRIRGHENEPAGKVFKNVRIPWLKTVSAEDFVGIMNGGYSRALGVACTHCHVEGDFASDALRPKRAAREMAVMHRRINDDLGKMRNLVGKPEERYINCAVCHRGAVDPRGAGE